MNTNEIKRLLTNLQSLNNAIADLTEQKDYFQEQIDKGIETTYINSLDPHQMFSYEVNYKDVIRQANVKLNEKHVKFMSALQSVENLTNE